MTFDNEVELHKVQLLLPFSLLHFLSLFFPLTVFFFFFCPSHWFILLFLSLSLIFSSFFVHLTLFFFFLSPSHCFFLLLSFSLFFSSFVALTVFSFFCPSHCFFFFFCLSRSVFHFPPSLFSTSIFSSFFVPLAVFFFSIFVPLTVFFSFFCPSRSVFHFPPSLFSTSSSFFTSPMCHFNFLPPPFTNPETHTASFPSFSLISSIFGRFFPVVMYYINRQTV